MSGGAKGGAKGVSPAPAPMAESLRSRWRRRSRTIPVMVGATVVGVVGLPVITVAAVVADIARGRFRFPSLRVALFLLQYGLNDCAEIVVAPVLWLWAGCGSRLSGQASMRRHEAVQAWSLTVLARRAESLLGLRVATDDEIVASLRPGPVIVLCCHVNLVDASLPSLLYLRLRYRTRGVIMAELLADPGFDLLYGRTGSVFIPRDDGPTARALVSQLGADVDSETAVVIFPEGRLFRPELLSRLLGRLAETDPERAERLAGLRRVLPPRPGGVLALLDALPTADVVVIAHSGLERYPTFRELARAVPLARPITVSVRRIAAADIPSESAQRIEWLDRQWLATDEWLAARARSL